jgi:hypothetical protein
MRLVVVVVVVVVIRVAQDFQIQLIGSVVIVSCPTLDT